MNQHFNGSGHLVQECYEVTKAIEYIELPTKIDMDIKELYFIDMWKPKYNQMNKHESCASLTIVDDDVWVVYKSDKQDEVSSIKSELEVSKSMLEQATNEVSVLHETVSTLTEKNAQLENLLQIKEQSISEMRMRSHAVIRERLIGNEHQPCSEELVDIDEAVLMLRANLPYRFTTTIKVKNTVVYELFRREDVLIIVRWDGTSSEEVTDKDLWGFGTKLTVLKEFGKITITSGQNLVEFNEELLLAKEILEEIKRKTAFIREYVKKADYSTRENLTYAISRYIKRQFTTYGIDGDYSKVYDFMFEKGIKNAKQLLGFLDKENGDDYGVAI